MSNNINNVLKSSLVCSAVLSALSSMPLYAAENESTADEGMERIMVTSRKKAESIIEVPMSVSTVSAMEIADRNLVNKEDIYRTVAGAASPRGELILRGLAGSNDSTPGTTSTFTDGIPYDFSDLYDVERVEVLRGPQGTLYGSNAIGGTVRVITKKPLLDEFEVNGSFQVNNQKRTSGNEIRGYAAINMPVSDTMAMRVTGSISDDPKSTTNVNTGVQGYNKDEMIRAQLLWQPQSDFRVNVSYIHENSRALGDSDSDTSTGFHSYYSAELTANEDAPFGYDVSLGASPDCNLSRVECLSDGPITTAHPKYAIWEQMDTRAYDEMDLIAVTIDDEDFFGLGSLSYAGSYRENKTGGMQDWSRTDGQDLFRSWIIDDYSTDRVTHELRLQNNNVESKFDWTVGYFYDKTTLGDRPNAQYQYHGDGDEGKALASYLWGVYWEYLGETNEDGEFVRYEFQSLDGSISQVMNNIAELGEFYWNDPNINYSQESLRDWDKEQALFGELSYIFDLDDMGELELNAGIRFYELEDSSEEILLGIWNGPTPTVAESTGKESGNRKKFSASWRPSDKMSVYGLYSEGYRPGGNNLPQLPQSCRDDPLAKFYKPRYESDEIQNYELGYKASLLDSKLSVAMAVYRIDWTGVQAPMRMGCGFRITANAAEAQTQGFEFESTYSITDDLTMTLNYGYTDAEMTSDVPALQVEKGDEMTMVPKYNGYLAFDQGFEIFNRQAYIRADLAVYGKYNSYFKGTELDEIPAYEVVNLSGRIEVNENTKLSLHINNLLDEEYFTYKRAASAGYSGAHWARYGKDRNVTFRIDFTF